ncbi:unnamed protein product [Caenorhabditis sp. 36 PRJEB53466]|nr:unnamed protein product [Caenorhabditis sp. 36 PRJEB53466]
MLDPVMCAFVGAAIVTFGLTLFLFFFVAPEEEEMRQNERRQSAETRKHDKVSRRIVTKLRKKLAKLTETLDDEHAAERVDVAKLADMIDELDLARVKKELMRIAVSGEDGWETLD